MSPPLLGGLEEAAGDFGAATGGFFWATAGPEIFSLTSGGGAGAFAAGAAAFGAAGGGLEAGGASYSVIVFTTTGGAAATFSSGGGLLAGGGRGAGLLAPAGGNCPAGALLSRKLSISSAPLSRPLCR